MPRGVYGNRNWTQEQIDTMDEMLSQGRSDESIGMCIGRSAEAVKVKRKKLGIRSRTQQIDSSHDVARKLGLGCSKIVTRWIKAGYLQGRRFQRRSKYQQWGIIEDALLAFLESPDYWHLWEPKRITDPGLREWAMERNAENFFTIGEVADRFCVGRNTANSWIKKGLLPARRRGNWLVPASALDGFTPPCERSKAGMKLREWTDIETARLLAMRHQGMTFQDIGKHLKRSIGSVAQRYYRVIERRKEAAA